MYLLIEIRHNISLYNVMGFTLGGRKEGMGFYVAFNSLGQIATR